MTIPHPDTIADLAPDCRRVLRDAYAPVQVRSQRLAEATRAAQRLAREAKRLRLSQEAQHRAREAERAQGAAAASLREAVDSYRDVAREWGVPA